MYRLTIKRSISTAAILYGCVFTLHAQKTESTYAIGINAGSFIYQGDLTPNPLGSFKTPGFVFGVNGSKRLSNAFAIRLDASFGGLKGDDSKYAMPAWRQQRNFNFKSPVTEVTAMLVWNALGSGHMFSPYLFAGLGYSFLHIKRDYSKFDAEYFSNEPTLNARLAQDSAHALPNGIPIVPLGIGLRCRLTSNISLTAEASYRYTQTDYLDGFSKAANPSKNDHYQKYAVGIQYTLGKKSNLSCPVIKY